MGRGLSGLQKGILGLAYTVNVHTQGGGAARAKDPPTYYPWPIPCDYRTPLGVCLLYRVDPSLSVTWTDPGPGRGEITRAISGYFAGSPAARAAKVATSRAAADLARRGLLARSDLFLGGWGYILTEGGIEAGRADARPVPLIAETLAYFHMTRDACFLIDRPGYIRALAAELAKAVSVDDVDNVITINR
jgi:hypothetical protein